MVILADSVVNLHGNDNATANLRLGWNQDSSGSTGNAVGLLEALEGTVNLHLNELVVGYGNEGAATGTLRWDQPGTPIFATTVYFARGK